MKNNIAIFMISISVLTGCDSMPSKNTTVNRPLGSVELLQQPGVEFEFPSGKVLKNNGSIAPPPKTIDCSNLKLNPDSFEAAIDAGALVVRIKTPTNVNQISEDEEGKKKIEKITIKPAYGGVLALCNVSENAKGPDSRSYRIRGLDEYFIKGGNGLVSTVGAVLSFGATSQSSNKSNRTGQNLFANMLGGLELPSLQGSNSSGRYSWMLWLSDRTATFTDYEASLHH